MIENISIIKTVLELLGIIWRFTKKIFGGKVKPEYQMDIPKKTIIVAPNPHPRSTWWHMGSSSGKPAMQITGDFKVTNITKYNILLCAAKMKKPKVLGSVIVKDSKSNYHGSYPIPATSVAKLSFHFWITPPFKEKGDPFTADVAILDQFGNEHWIKRIQFIYT